VHDAGRLPDGRAYYVMKLVRGTCLDAHLPALGPGLGPRLRLFQRVCDAVAFAHAHGVVHRDLKPQNVMVGPFGEVLVMDWGVARVLDAAAPPPGPAAGGEGGTRAGTVLGTPGYMAPEQAAGRAALADERSDVYALGALLHFLIAEVEPAGAGAPTLREAAARRGEAVARPLAAVVARALAAEPARRYQRVTDLALDVEAWLANAPVSAYRENWIERGRRLLDKHRTPVLLVLAYLFMRVMLLAFWR
jgi:serine/threonine protein kinase